MREEVAPWRGDMLEKIVKIRRPLSFLFSSLFLLLLSFYIFLVYDGSPLWPNSISNTSSSLQSFVDGINFDGAEINISRICSDPEQNTCSMNASKQENLKDCSSDGAKLKVYMYDLPASFHFGLLGWKGKRDERWPDVTKIDKIPRYPGGLNLQHSIEYWLTLDLLASSFPQITRPCFSVLVRNSSSADVIFVPFFSSLSYNRHSKLRGNERISKDKFLQQELVKFLVKQEEWKRSGGRDHVIIAHHPNSMSSARGKVRSSIFVLADFGRYPVQIANLQKDIIAPYRHVVNGIGDDSAQFNDRPILAYFQGAIYRKDGGLIRRELYHILKDEKDVHFAFGTPQRNGIIRAGQGMASSKFCLNIAGDTPSSNRLFDAIVSHCVPVVISDGIELPFEDVLDYSEFCIFVSSTNAVKKGNLMNLLKRINQDEWTRMWERLKQIAHHFEYQYPSQPADAVQMIWEAIARKVSKQNPGNLTIHREHRYSRYNNALS